MSYGYAYRAFETTVGTGTGALDVDGAVSGYQTLVDAAKEASGAGTGPWSIEIVITDVPGGGTDWEVFTLNVEEGTGGGGKDQIRRDTGTCHASSNSDSPVNWGSGTKNVFIAPRIEKIGALLDKVTGTGVLRRLSATSFSTVALGAIGISLIPETTSAGGRATLDAMEDVFTTQGDMVYEGASAEARLGIGSTGQFLRVAAGLPSWFAHPLPADLVGGDALKAPVVNSGGTAYELRRATTSSITDGTLVDGVFFEAFESSAQNIPSGGNTTITVSHGMARRPLSVELWLQCATTDGNYSAGDEINATGIMDGAGTHTSMIAEATSTQVIVHIANTAQPFRIVDPALGAVNLTEENWDLIVRAWTWKV